MAKIYPNYSPVNAFVKAGSPVIAAMSSVTALLSNPLEYEQNSDEQMYEII